MVNRPVGFIYTRSQGKLDVMSYKLPLEANEGSESVEARVQALEDRKLIAGTGLDGGGVLGTGDVSFSVDVAYLDARYAREGAVNPANSFAYAWMVACP